MANPQMSKAKAAQIDKMLSLGHTSNAIVKKLGAGYAAVERRRKLGKFPATKNVVVHASVKEPMPEDILQAAIKKLLKKEPRAAAGLASELGVTQKRVKESVKEMISRGAMIVTNLEGAYDLTPHFAAQAGKAEIKSENGKFKEWSQVFGFVTDNHLCNKHSRLDVLNAAYDTFERMGITTVYNAGNWIDGEARFNKTELITAPGMDNQLDYMIDKYPVKKGIVTHYIAGDDHCGWYQQREGIEIGRYLQHKAEAAGRHDLKYLGYGEADVALMHGTGSAVMRVVHPGGGSSYAISYTDQRRVESYQGGEKPHVELVGHYHKFNYGYPREVHTLQGGCTCEQTMFMRKKRLAAHIGFSVVKIAQDSNGAVTRFAPEWFPFFDLGYYKKRF